MNKTFLKNLLQAPSPSGYEEYATKIVKNYLEERGVKYEFTDKVGNTAFSVGNGNTVIMLSAHIDEIGLQVQHIDEKGFIHFIKDGGTDAKVLPGSTVAIHTAKGIVNGVIGKTPIHIEYHTDDKDKAIKVKDMKIDIGAESKEEANKFISIGDPITICDIPLELGANRFAGRGLDDKVGVYVMAEVMKQLKNLNLQNVKVYGVACTQEETSASGAVGAASKINPQYSIDYDVTFATDDDYVSPNEWGDIKLGKGGAIAHGVDSNRKLTRLMKEVCETNKIPYQEFSVGSGGTDTVWIKQSSEDCDTLLLSIPNRNMHTQVEVCDYRDLESLVRMTVSAIIRINNGI